MEWLAAVETGGGVPPTLGDGDGTKEEALLKGFVSMFCADDLRRMLPRDRLDGWPLLSAGIVSDGQRVRLLLYACSTSEAKALWDLQCRTRV